MKTNIKKGLTLPVLVMNAWQEYQQNGYPKDPNCYVVRASPAAVAEMRHIAIANKEPKDFKIMAEGEQRFLHFRLIEDPKLAPEEVYFGPETIRIEWSEV